MSTHRDFTQKEFTLCGRPINIDEFIAEDAGSEVIGTIRYEDYVGFLQTIASLKVGESHFYFEGAHGEFELRRTK